ncbi:hypothetical protein Efla_000297 [Eimeria flavescens]
MAVPSLIPRPLRLAAARGPLSVPERAATSLGLSRCRCMQQLLRPDLRVRRAAVHTAAATQGHARAAAAAAAAAADAAADTAHTAAATGVERLRGFGLSLRTQQRSDGRGAAQQQQSLQQQHLVRQLQQQGDPRGAPHQQQPLQQQQLLQQLQQLQQLAAAAAKQLTQCLTPEFFLWGPSEGRTPQQAVASAAAAAGSSMSSSSSSNQWDAPELLLAAADAHAAMVQLRLRDLTAAQLHAAIQSAAVLLLLERSLRRRQQQQQQLHGSSSSSSSSNLERFARAAFCLYEERLHLLPLADPSVLLLFLMLLLLLLQVARSAWLSVAVLPEGIASDLYPLAVSARMHAGLQQQQQQQQEQHQQEQQQQEQQQQRLDLASVADVLHPFSHERLRLSMPFLRDPFLLAHLTAQVAAAPDAPREVLLKLLHTYTGIPEARSLLQLLLSRLDASLEELPDAVVVDVCAAAGSLPIFSGSVAAAKGCFLGRAKLMHPQAAAEATAALADHLSAEDLLHLSELLLQAVDALQPQQQLSLLLLYKQRCVAAQRLLEALEMRLLRGAGCLTGEQLSLLSVACCSSNSSSSAVLQQLHAAVGAAIRRGALSPNGAAECLLSLSICGVSCSDLLCLLDWPEVVAACGARAVCTLAWLAAAQQFKHNIAWQALAAAAPRVLRGRSCSVQFFEALTAAQILGLHALDVEQLPLEQQQQWRLAAAAWQQHEAWKAAAAREQQQQQRVPPYALLLQQLGLDFVAAAPTCLYTAPFLLKSLNLIFEPLKNSPIHLGSGQQMGEVSLRHSVWSNLGFNTLTLMHSEFEGFCTHTPEVYVHPRDPLLPQQQQTAPRQYDLKAAAAHLKQKLDACKPRLRELRRQEAATPAGRPRLLLQHERLQQQQQPVLQGKPLLPRSQQQQEQQR